MNEDFSITDSEIEEFDKLYDGNLSEEDYYLIMAKLQLDEVLRNKYLIYKNLRREIELDGIANRILKNRFISIERKLRKKKIRFTVIISSFFLVFIAFGLLRFNNNISIYEKYKDSEAGFPIKMSQNTNEAFNFAMVQIGNGAYEDAILTLTSLPKSDTIIYFTAYCAERLGDFKEAKERYEDLVESNSPLISQKSAFRSALLKFRTQKNEGITEMEIIANDPEHLYKRLAQEIIDNEIKD